MKNNISWLLSLIAAIIAAVGISHLAFVGPSKKSRCTSTHPSYGIQCELHGYEHEMKSHRANRVDGDPNTAVEW